MPKQKEIKFEQPSQLLLLFNKYSSIIIGIVVLIVLLVGYFFVLVPKINEINEIRDVSSENVRKSFNNEIILKQIEDLAESYDQIIEERQEDLANLNKIIPEEPKIAELFVMAEKIAKEYNFTLNSITVVPRSDLVPGTTNIKQVTISISVAYNYVKEEETDEEEVLPADEEGALSLDSDINRDEEEKEVKTTYEGFKDFVVALQNNLRLMDIQSMNFGVLPIAEDGTPAQSQTPFSFTITAYYK